MIDYLEFLRKTEVEYLNLSVDDLKKRLNETNNCHPLINKIKNFIFIHNYIPTESLVSNCVQQSDDDCITENLIKEYRDGERRDKKGDKRTKSSYKFSYDFLHFVCKKINKIKIIDRRDENFDYSAISDDFNNFFNYENMIGACRNKSELKSPEPVTAREPQETPSDVIMEREIENDCGYVVTKKFVYPRYFEDTKILITNFSVPYKEKKLKDFDFNKDIFKDLNIKQKLLLSKIIDKYDTKTKYVNKSNLKNNNINYLSYYKIVDGKAVHCHFECKDEKTIHNTEIAYNIIKNHFFDDEKKLFDNHEFFFLQKKLEEVVCDEKNKVFYIFDLYKAFYITPFNNIKQTCKTLFVDEEKYLHFLVLWDYFENIRKNDCGINFLPITKYSGLIFKLYLKSILSSVNYDNYFVYVDDFIVYGTEETTEVTFDAIFRALRNDNRQLSTFAIYDKTIHNGFTFLNKEFKFKRTDFIFKDQVLDIEVSIGTNYNGYHFNKTLATLFKNNLNIDPKNNLNISFKKKDEEEKEKNDICALCKDNKKNLCLTCGHLLCQDCYDNIIKPDVLSRCPFCRVQAQSFTKVFL